MKTILVSLVGKQTVPNVLVAAHFRPQGLLFLTTKESEEQGRTDAILEALRDIGAVGEEVRLRVNANSLRECVETIGSFLEKVDDEVEYIVNITGGTKIMAIAAFEMFREMGAKILYLPMGKNRCTQIFPKKRPLYEFDISVRLSVKQYLLCYGYRIVNQKRLSDRKDTAIKRRNDTEWILANYERLKGLLGFLYKNLKDARNKKSFELSAYFDRGLSSVEREFCRKFGFQVRNGYIKRTLKKDESRYFTGEWLEEYVFCVVNGLAEKGLIDDVVLDANVKSQHGVENQLDVIFTENNVLYHLECKTLGDEGGGRVITGEIYKRGALATLLGDGNYGYVCTTQNVINESLRNRAKEYKLHPPLTLADVRNLENLLKERIDKDEHKSN